MAQLKDSVVQGSLRVTDTTYTTAIQTAIFKAPIASNGTTYGPGTTDYVLMSNGTSVYWGTGVTNALKALDVSTIGNTNGTKYIAAISQADGKISATAVDVTTSYSATGTTAISGTGVAAALNTLDSTLPSGSAASKTLTALTITDGKMASATFSDIAIGAGQITSGTLSVARGGTGISTASYTNAIIAGNASTATNAFQAIRTNNGAFYATAQDGTPSFGILPVAQGGTNLTTITQGGIIYAASTSAYGCTSAGTANQILISGGTGTPTWKPTANGAAYATSANGSLTFGTLPVAQGGTNLTSITQGGIIYAASTTTYGCTAVGTSGYLLQSNATSAPSWIQATDSNVASTIVKRDNSGDFSANVVSANLNGIIQYQSNLAKGTNPTSGSTLWTTFCAIYETGTGRAPANRIGGIIESSIEDSGKTNIILRAYKHESASTAVNEFRVSCAADGTASYSVSNAYNFCKAIGAPQIKTASFTSVTLNTSGYTYSDSWITASTAIVATDLQTLSLPGIVTWTISDGKIVFKCTVSASLSFSIMMLKPCT